MNSDPFNLSPLWNGLLSIYNEIVSLCDRHGLRYYAADGTALGAMRHNGFIPWDDDFDIFMPRPDYEKFKVIANHELPVYLRFVNHENTPEFKLLFGKIQDVRRDKIESIEEATGRMLSNGLFVDIFPLDGYPSSFFKKGIIRFLSLVFIQYKVVKNNNFRSLPLKGKIRWIIGAIVFPFCRVLKGEKDPLLILEELYKQIDYDSSILVSSYDCTLSIFRKNPLLKEVFAGGVEHEFFKQIIMLPRDCERFLENEYGDWRQLPPEDERYPTHEYAYRCPWWLGPTKSPV